MKIAPFVVSVALASVVSACGGSSSDDADLETPSAETTAAPSGDDSAEPAGSGYGDWTFQDEFVGASGVITLTEDPRAFIEDPVVAAVEKFREGAGADPVLYVRVALDNTSGDSEMQLQEFTLVTKDGEQVTGTSVGDYVGVVQDQVAEDDSDTYNEGVAIYNDQLDRSEILPGAKATYYVVFSYDPSTPNPEIGRVFIQPSIYSERISAQTTD